MASMSDNPLVGDYTKGVSKNSHAYFVALERRARAEKYAISKMKIDFENPLFSMLRAPLDPLKMLEGRDRISAPAPVSVPKKEAEKSHKRDPEMGRKGSKKWVKVALADLSRAFRECC